MSDDIAAEMHAPWSKEPSEVVQTLASNQEEGLSEKEVRDRIAQYGYNRLRRHRKRSLLAILVDQFKSIIIALLAAAAVVAFWMGESIDAAAILIVILLNTLIGFFTELRAIRSMEALFKLGQVISRVLRNGSVKEVDAEQLVPGDIVIFEGGDVITADLRILEASKLQADESALTGESMPVNKKNEAVAEDRVLAERNSMLYKGTAITRGSGEGIVVATGLDTELGQISSLVDEAESERTPLEDRLDKLGYRLIGITLLIAAFVIGAGIISGKDIYLMVETGIALAVAAIPEGLPIVATIALAKGVQLMAEKNALINRLSSVETLGSTGIICTDKTGTLTENKMTVTQVYLPEEETEKTLVKAEDSGEADLPSQNEQQLQLALETGVLCNNASLSKDGHSQTGDPLEVALLEWAQKNGMDPATISDRYPELREEAFDPEVQMMATWNRIAEAQYRVHVKGAPAAVLEACDTVMLDGEAKPLNEEYRAYWQELNRKLAGQGLRMISLAFKETTNAEGDPYQGLSLVGLLALSDPPRTDVKPAIESCHKAGIRVVMVTGDQVATAQYVAEAVGLKNGEGNVIHGSELAAKDGLSDSEIGNTAIFARINPRQKLDLIDRFQKQKYIVAMTGDGVNDAPALKKADIGIAMGQRGTQVAREAADMVLTDDAFSTIVTAIEQGRVIFGNIRRFIFYLMSCNLSEIMVVGLGAFLGTPLPILPLQILFLNLVTDVFPALALGVGPGDKSVMEHSPRDPSHPLLGRTQWVGIAFYSILITLSVLGALVLSLYYFGLSRKEAVTISFLTLAMAQLWHVFNITSRGEAVFYNTVTRNPYVWGALALCLGLLLTAVYQPTLARIMQITPPNLLGWSLIIIMSLLPLIFGQLRKLISRADIYSKKPASRTD